MIELGPPPPGPHDGLDPVAALHAHYAPDETPGPPTFADVAVLRRWVARAIPPDAFAAPTDEYWFRVLYWATCGYYAGLVAQIFRRDPQSVNVPPLTGNPGTINLLDILAESFPDAVVTMGAVGLTVAQWGWCVNAARRLFELPPVAFVGYERDAFLVPFDLADRYVNRSARKGRLLSE